MGRITRQVDRGIRAGGATGLLGLLALVGLGWFALTSAAMHFIQPELNPIETFGSQYANGTAGWLVNLGFVMAGMGTIALALALGRSLTTGKLARSAVVALVIAGVGFAGSGVFPEDVPLADGTVGYSFSGGMHALAGVLLFLGVIVATFLLAGAFRRSQPWQAVAGRARLSAWLLLAGLIVSLVSEEVGAAPGTDGSVAGLLQRIVVTGMLLWLGWLAFRVRSIAAGRVRDHE